MEPSQSEDDYRAVLNNMTDVFYRVDTQGLIILVSTSVTKLLGYSVNELIGKQLADLYAQPDDRSKFLLSLEESGGNVIGYELQLCCKDGSYVWVSTSSHYNRDTDGNIVGVEGTARDITELKEAREAMRDSEERFRSFFENANIGMTHTDLDGRFQRVNATFCKMVGYSEPELQNKTVVDITHPDDRNEMITARRQLDDGSPRLITFEKKYLHRDGRTIWGLVSRGEVQNANGITQYAIAQVVDITDRKDTELRLSESEERLNQAQQLAGFGCFERNLIGESLYWSDGMYSIFGLSKVDAKLSHKLFLDQVYPDDREKVVRAIQRSLDEQAAQETEFRIQRSDGAIRHVSTIRQSVRDADGQPIRIMGTLQDITEQKQAEEENAKLNRVLRCISESNSAMMRATSEIDLLNQICNIIVDVGGYLMTWIGYAEEEAKAVTPIAWAGFGTEYIDGVKATWKDVPRGQGPAGIAMRTGKPNITHDLENDPGFAPWREEALRQGYRSAMAFPLIDDEQRLGLLIVYAAMPNTFNEAEITLFSDLADNIVYGIRSLRTDEQRHQAEEGLHQANEGLEQRVVERTAELRENEQRFQDFAKSGADRFWETNKDHKFIYFSSPVGRLQSDVEAFMGATPWDTTFNGLDTGDWRGLRTKMLAHKPFRDFPYMGYSPDERDLFVNLSGTPIFDEQENFKGYRGMVTDVSFRVEAQKKNEIEHQRLIDALESVTDGVSLYDENDRLVLCNARLKEELSEISELLVPGTTYEDIVRAIFKQNIGMVEQGLSLDEQIRRQLEYHNSPVESLFRQEKDGRWLMLHEYKTKEGGTFFIRSNISELKQAQNEAQIAKEVAEIADRSKSEFLANMSHELRTPLNAIIGFSDAIETEIFGPLGNVQYKGYIGDIHKSGHHLLNLINNILDVSVIEAGMIELRESDIHLDETVATSLLMVKSRAEVGGIKLVNSIADPAPIIHADELKMKQILVNLLSNAVKFTPAGGKVTVNADIAADKSVFIKITDTGIGMDTADLAKAMEKFGQTERGDLMQAGEGTGLGLPLTKGLVEAHGGTLEIESESNKGTTVIVRIPQERVLN